MGKDKGQRTKNNARPSNSSRSAEFLGAAAPGFVGFSAAKDGGFVPFLPGLAITSNTEMTNVDPSFQMVFKKMSKKDGTTKYKALSEFSELVTTQDLAVVEAMLPFWPRLYCSLSIDVNHRVREAAQLAHATLVKRVGKTVATILKQVAGPWFVAQYDMYPPAASAASNCFNSTFSPQKVVSAIVHCQDEILNYICDNIIVLSPQALLTNKAFPLEEMEAKYQKILTSSLQAYNFYLKTVTLADIEKTAEYHKKLVSSNKFWKLAKNEDLAVKTAFFNAITALICYAYDIISAEKKKFLTTIMNSLDELDPTVLSAVWESLLVSINKVEDWHTIVSLEKLVLPKLWRVLKNGGQYSASVIYPNLLPFLSQFTKFDIDRNTIYTNFFENMRQGFTVKSVKFSRSEAFAVMTSFVECLRYAILVNSSNTEFCENLVKNQLMPVVECNLNDSQTSLRSIFFSELSRLLRYWSKNSENPDHPSYGQLMRLFWQELTAIFNRLIEEAAESEAISNVVGSMSELLQYLRRVPEQGRRNMRVKFSDTTETSPVTPIVSKESTEDTPEEVCFLAELQQFVTGLCLSYFGRIVAQPLKYRITELVRLINGHENRKLFIELAHTCGEDASLLQFYVRSLKPLLCAKDQETEALVNLVFSLVSYMMDEEKQEVLRSFEEVEEVEILKRAVHCALTKKYREDNVVRKWCREAVITKTLVQTAEQVLSSLKFTDFEEQLFEQTFEPSQDGGLIVSDEAICGISSRLCQMVDNMSWESGKQIQEFASLLARLLALSWNYCQVNTGAIQLLRALFRLHVRDCLERTDEEPESTIVLVAREAWTRGIQELGTRISQDEFSRHVKYFATIVWDKIFSTNEPFKDSLIRLSSSFIDAVVKSSDRYTEKFVLTFLTELDIRKWMKQSCGIILYGEVITGNFYVSKLVQKVHFCQETFEIDLCSTDFKDHTHKCLKWAAASARILNNLLQNTADLPEVIEIIVSLSYVAALGDVYAKHYNSTKYSNEVNTLRKVLRTELNGFKTFLSADVHKDVIADIHRMLLTHGNIYVYVLKFYQEFFTPENTLSELFESYQPDVAKKFNYRETLLQCRQMLCNSSSLEKILSSLDDESDFYKIFLARNKFDENNLPLLANIFERITNRQQNEPSTLLLHCDTLNVSWEEFILPFEVILFLTKCVTIIPKKLTISQWDIIEICLASLQLSIRKSIDNVADFKIKAIIISVNRLYSAIQQLMNDHAKTPIEELPASLLDEWENVFASDLQNDSFKTWMMFAELYNKKDISITSVIPLNYLGKSLEVFHNSVISKDNLTRDDPNKQEEEIIELLLKLIHSPVLSLQLGAYHGLNNVISVLVERDKALIEVENFDVKSLNIYKFEQVLKTAQNIVNTILMDFKLCDTISCTIQPYTDSYTYTIGYLFTWGIVLNMCAKAHGDLRYHYAELLKDDYFPNLLNNIFRLMPVEVLHDTKNKNAKLVEIFSTEPSYEFTDSWTEWRLDHQVCWLYTNCLRYLPVLVRQWWSTADSRVSAAVDKITTLYVSPFLCNEELYDNRLANVENIQVKVHPTSREVVALYQMDDTKLELNIILPPNHPLGTVNVEPGQHAGGTANWRNCHMQLSIFLTHQNGSIWDGLMLWKANLDKRFAGVEECYICFSIFHISTYQIPKLSCRTCRKKFHTPCLYKWFNTSHKSTCPICRNVF